MCDDQDLLPMLEARLAAADARVAEVRRLRTITRNTMRYRRQQRRALRRARDEALASVRSKYRDSLRELDASLPPESATYKDYKQALLEREEAADNVRMVRFARERAAQVDRGVDYA